MPGDSSRPPIPPLGSYHHRQCFADGDCRPTLVRHVSFMKTRTLDAPAEPEKSRENCGSEFLPVVRSGGWADIGFRHCMEDVYVCCDNLMHEYGYMNIGDGPNAFYATVFDGHGGKHAADFSCSNLLRFILEDDDFPMDIEKVVASAFLQTDTAFAEACSLDSSLASGTTALACACCWKVIGGGKCWGLQGRALPARQSHREMSRDHKPACSIEEANQSLRMIHI